MKVSIRTISEMTGYSPATVSNALNHKRGVNAETSAEIFRVAHETGYIQENSAFKIKLVIFKKNGLIIDDTPFFQTIISNIEQECRNNGYELTICTLDQRDNNYEMLEKNILQDSSSAIIALATELTEADYKRFYQALCPIVLLDCCDDAMKFHSVLINNDDSACIATEYLIKKGHSRIGYLRGAFRIKAFRSRFSGFQMAFRKNRMAYEEKYIYTLRTTLNEAYRDMMRYLDENKELPTAFFADNDMIAMGAMKALLEKGYRIPDDISIVGFDDLPYAEIFSPALTTIRVPRGEMGRLAVRKVISLVSNPNQIITKTQVCTTFVERETVRQLRN